MAKGMTDQRTTTLEISKEDFKFSGAHFTIFGPGDRERLHGHNFKVRVKVTSPVDDNGLCFNYQEIKKRVRVVCKRLDEYLILPALSPYLTCRVEAGEVFADFGDERLRFPEGDTLLLPIRNTTVEEFSYYLLNELVSEDTFFEDNHISFLEIGVSSGDGQWGTTQWHGNSDKP